MHVHACIKNYSAILNIYLRHVYILNVDHDHSYNQVQAIAINYILILAKLRLSQIVKLHDASDNMQIMHFITRYNLNHRWTENHIIHDFTLAQQ